MSLPRQVALSRGQLGYAPTQTGRQDTHRMTASQMKPRPVFALAAPMAPKMSSTAHASVVRLLSTTATTGLSLFRAKRKISAISKMMVKAQMTIQTARMALRGVSRSASGVFTRQYLTCLTYLTADQAELKSSLL